MVSERQINGQRETDGQRKAGSQIGCEADREMDRGQHFDQLTGR